jgi:hypothetical protein
VHLDVPDISSTILNGDTLIFPSIPHQASQSAPQQPDIVEWIENIVMLLSENLPECIINCDETI